MIPLLNGYADNKNVALFILNIRNKKQHVQGEIMQIFNVCCPHFINIDTEWIPRTKNEIKELIIRLKFMTTMIGVFLIFFSTGWRSFGVHKTSTASPII